MAMQSDELRQLLEAVNESNKWLRIIALPTVRSSLETALNTSDARKVYQASDGRQIRDVAKAAGVGYGTVHRYWSKWAKSGLVQETAVRGRFERLIDLEDVGIEVED
jgi:hypothetical protein